MLSSKFKDLKVRNIYLRNEKKIILQRFLFLNLLNDKKLTSKKLFYIYVLLKNRRLSFNYKVRTKIVRRCVISNRSRSNFKKYGLSRFYMRNLIQFGVLPGFKKAV
jgi:ribosomal protein S14